MAKKDELPMNKHDAAVILTSAIFYCQQAGYDIHVGEKNGRLWLGFAGLELIPGENGAAQRFIPADLVTNIGNPAGKESEK